MNVTRAKSNGRAFEWELRVLDCVFAEPELWSAIKHLKICHFFLPCHRAVYGAMARLDRIDLVNLHSAMVADGHEVEFAEFNSVVPVWPKSKTNDLPYYLSRMQKEYKLRELGRHMDGLVTAIADGQGVTQEQLSHLGELLPGPEANGDGPPTECNLVSFENIKEAHLHPLWPGYLPLGKLVHLAGNSGEGKSPLVLDIIARMTTGREWPDGTPNTLGPRSAILFSAEDDPADTQKPRLKLAGADMSKIYIAKMTKLYGGTRQEILFALDRDLQVLTETMMPIDDLALVAMDPLSNYLGRVQMKAEEEVRGVLMPLANAAAKLNVCMLTIGHLNKREKGTSPLQRVMGAAAFVGVARFIYFAGADPDDEDRHAHVLVQQRGGNSPSLRYRTYATPVTWDGETSDVVGVEWRGRSEASSQDAVDPTAGAQKSDESKAAEALRELVAKDGRIAVKEAQELLKDKGFDVAGPNAKMNWGRVLRKAGADSKRFDREKFYSVYLPAK